MDHPSAAPPHRDALVDALVRSAFDTTAVLTRVAAENELSLTQLRALAVLRGRRLRMAVLAAHLGLEKSTLSGLIDRAERRGLVARAAAADDGRAVEVFLSDAGIELAERLGHRIRDALAPAAAGLSAAEQNRLQSLLDRLAAGRSS